MIKSKLDFTPPAGMTAQKAFEEMALLREKGIARYDSTITVNGVTYLAGIFEFYEEFLSHAHAIDSGDKEQILETIPKGKKPVAIAYDFACINEVLKSKGYQTFTNDEFEDFMNQYNGKSL